MTPVNQVLTPLGRQVDLPGMRPQAIALSPDGSILALSGKSSGLVVIDPNKGSIRRRVQLPSDDQELPANPISDHNLKPDRHGRQTLLEPVPIDERVPQKWNHDPYAADGGGDGRHEESGAEWLMPYWMAVYHKLIVETL